MTPVLRIFIAFLLALVVTGSAFAQREATAEDGTYLISATSASGESYEGALFMTDVIGQEPLLIVTGHFDPFYRGIGYVVNGVVGIAYGGPHCSLAMYSQANNGMRGIWSSPALDGVRSQAASIDAFDEAAGVMRFHLSSALGDDKASLGDLVLEDGGDTARVTMTLDDQEYMGTGVVVSDTMVVVYGDEACGVAAYDTSEAARLEGVRVGWGSTDVANESGVMPRYSGAFSVAGANPDGSEYEGTLDITSESYHHSFTWQIGEMAYEGVALLRAGVMGVGWGGDNCGVTVYNVTQRGHLDGDIFYPAYELQGWETAERIDPVEGGYAERIAGAYRVVERQNPSGERFNDTDVILTVTPVASESELYDVRWDFPDGTFMNGTGIYLYNTLTVGFGGDMCGVSAYYAFADELIGLWAMVGGTTLGSEVAVR